MQFTKANNAILFSCLVLFLTPFLSSAQTQFSEDIYGKSNGDQLGAVEMPDAYTTAIRPMFSVPIRIYRRIGSKWFQKGSEIPGGVFSFSMPDSNTLAIETGNGARVFKWNGKSWSQKGNNIIAALGNRISMPDSNTIAIGSPLNDSLAEDAGLVRVFKWNGNNWVQMGNSIVGRVARYHQFGHLVTMPDSVTIAISGRATHTQTLPPIGSPPSVRIYRWNGTYWAQMGNDIETDSLSVYNAMSMPDATTIALRLNNGQVRIYRWYLAAASWFRKGNSLAADADPRLDSYYYGSLYGSLMSMPDSNTLAVGNPFNDSNGTDAGQLRIYKWNDSSHVWVQYGNDILGKAGDRAGASVIMPDSSTLAVGAPLNDNQGNNRGQVRFYSFCISKDTINVSACNEYISPSGEYKWTRSGQYEDVLVNAAGCDSIITINLNLNSSFDTLSLTECTAYQSPSGKYNWNKSGQYQDTLVNAAGCDI